jgi:hypothetical protein
METLKEMELVAGKLVGSAFTVSNLEIRAQPTFIE